MLLMRKFEEKAGQLYGQQTIRGFCHLYTGQEAIVAGTMSLLSADDSLITANHDHAHALAKGVSADACMAELFGKVTGCSKGKGGSMHFFCERAQVYGRTRNCWQTNTFGCRSHTSQKNTWVQSM